MNQVMIEKKPLAVKDAAAGYQIKSENVCPKGYKQTEVGLIPDDWEMALLGEAVDFLDGMRRPIKSSERAKMQGIYPYYGASGIVDYVNGYLFDENLVLLGEDGENILSRNTRLAFKVSGKIWVNNHAHVLRPKPDFEIIYLTEYLESLDYSLRNSGTAQPKLNKKTCQKIPVVKPPKKEQHAIAEALSDVDALIASLGKLIVKKRAIKTATMQHLLTGKIRLPEFEGNMGYKESELGLIPKDWGVVKLPDVLSFVSGKAHEQYIVEFGAFVVVNSKFVSTNGLVAKYTDRNFCPAKKSDILMVMSDLPNGKALAKCFIVDKGGKYAVNQRVCILRAKGVDPVFYYYLLNRHQYFLKFDDGVQQTHLLNKVFLECPVLLPSSKSEQEAISLILSDIDKEISILESRLEKTKDIKKGMMQELLTGRTRLL